MFKKIIFLFLILFCEYRSDAQIPENLHFGNFNATGNTILSGAYIFDWNLGSTFTQSFTDNKFLLLTSGFIQSKDFEKIISPSLDSLLDMDKKMKLISLYPNPTNNYIFILNPQNDIHILNIFLYNAKGDLVKHFEPPYSTSSYNKMISLSSIISGTYIFSINYIIAGKYLRTKFFRIIKI